MNSEHNNTKLGDILIKLNFKYLYIPDYIKKYAKTKAVPKLKHEFEELIKTDKRFYGYARQKYST